MYDDLPGTTQEMYDDLPGTTQEMYGDFPLAFCSHLITQTPFKGYSTANYPSAVQGHSRNFRMINYALKNIHRPTVANKNLHAGACLSGRRDLQGQLRSSNGTWGQPQRIDGMGEAGRALSGSSVPAEDNLGCRRGSNPRPRRCSPFEGYSRATQTPFKAIQEIFKGYSSAVQGRSRAIPGLLKHRSRPCTGYSSTVQGH